MYLLPQPPHWGDLVSGRVAVREYLTSGYGLRFSTGANGRKRFSARTYGKTSGNLPTSLMRSYINRPQTPETSRS